MISRLRGRSKPAAAGSDDAPTREHGRPGGQGGRRAEDHASDPTPGGSRIPAQVARKIRLVVLDVDGVLTDAGVYLGQDGSGMAVEFKRFDIQDGLGLRLLQDAGIQVALVSGRVSGATEVRARELGIEACHQVSGAHKLPVVRGLCKERGLAWDEVAMVADDLPDLPVMERVGLPVAVGNAVGEVRRAALWTTRRNGGHGAVREFCRVLLEARGEWESRVEAYVDARRGEHGPS